MECIGLFTLRQVHLGRLEARKLPEPRQRDGRDPQADNGQQQQPRRQRQAQDVGAQARRVELRVRGHGHSVPFLSFGGATRDLRCGSGRGRWRGRWKDGRQGGGRALAAVRVA